MKVLGLDPGTRKCGLALVAEPGAPPEQLAIVPLEGLAARLRELREVSGVTVAAVGRGTNASAVVAIAREAGFAVTLVDEHETTLRARRRYFRDHPPRGWKRLIPLGMLLPERPIDDYAALLIAERFLGDAS